MTAVVQSCGHPPLPRHGCGLPAGQVRSRPYLSQVIIQTHVKPPEPSFKLTPTHPMPHLNSSSHATSRVSLPPADPPCGIPGQLHLPRVPTSERAGETQRGHGGRGTHAAHGAASAATRRGGQWGRDRWRCGQWGRDRWRGSQWGFVLMYKLIVIIIVFSLRRPLSLFSMLPPSAAPGRGSR